VIGNEIAYNNPIIPTSTRCARFVGILGALYRKGVGLKILLLPGMDGTGVMFEPFINHAPKSAQIKVIKLIQDVGVTYREQAEVIAHGIIGENVTIIAESYSGVIAHELIKLAPNSIKHMVFAASFLDRPSIMLPLANIAPNFMLNHSLYPDFIVSRVLFGRYRSSHFLRLFKLAMSEVSIDLLKFRIDQISNLPPFNDTIEIQSTYQQAKQDNLISSSSFNAFSSAYSQINLRQLDGSHFLLQTNPIGCWDEVVKIAV
jgi:pimeloyl-ACP methyl ester carboxylesterase